MERDLVDGLSANAIIDAIDDHVAKLADRVWSIGVSNSPEQILARLNEREGSVATWNSWPALSLTAALEVERFYTKNGWRCGGAEHIRFRLTSFVYVY